MNIAISKFLSYFRLKNIGYFLFLVLIYFCFFYPIHQNTDYLGYKYIYTQCDWFNYEFVFRKISEFFYNRGYSFEFFYQSFYVLMMLIWGILINKLSKKRILLLLFSFPLIYIFMVNQIRYYFAFPVFLLGLYYFVFDNKKIAGGILFLLSFLSHSSIFLLFAIVPLYYIDIRKKIGVLQFFIFLLFIFLLLMFFNYGVRFFSVFNIKSFSGYLSTSMNFSGFLFLLLPGLTYISTIYLLNKSFSRYHFLYEDKLLNFLFKTSLFPFMLIGVFGNNSNLISRFINPFVVIWNATIFRYIYLSKRKYLVWIPIVCLLLTLFELFFLLSLLKHGSLLNGNLEELVYIINGFEY